MLHACRTQWFFTEPVWSAEVEDRKPASPVSDVVAQRIAQRPGSIESRLASLLGAQDVLQALRHLRTGPEIFMLEVIAAWPRYVAAQRDSSTRYCSASSLPRPAVFTFLAVLMLPKVLPDLL